MCEKLSDGLIHMEDGIARFDYEAYDPETVDEKMNVVLAKCPSKGLFQKIGKTTEASSATDDE